MATPIGTTRVLRRLLTGGVYSRAERLLERIHPADLGPLLAELTPDEIRTVIDLLFKQRRCRPDVVSCADVRQLMGNHHSHAVNVCEQRFREHDHRPSDSSAEGSGGRGRRQ